MSFRTISAAFGSSAAIVAALVTQLVSEAKGQLPVIESAKPVRSETLYVFTWPNGYSEVNTESVMNSGIVSNMDFSIVGPRLCIDRSEAMYCFTIAGVIIGRDVVTALQSYGLVDPEGFDLDWPRPLPPQSGPASYAVVNDPALYAPDEATRHAFDVLHEYYQSHYLELLAQAQVRTVAPTPTPTPTPSAPVTYKRTEYPLATPGLPQ